MATKPRILVTSAAGKTGFPTALDLLERGYPVRAFVRRGDARARTLKDAGADLFIGDQFDIRDLRTAFDGVQRAYVCAPTAPNGLHFGTLAAIAAQEARIEHVVLMTQWLSGDRHPSFFTREIWAMEQVFRRIGDLSLTVNNVGWFADNYFMVLRDTAQLGLFAMPLGDIDTPKDAPPSNEDIAAVNVEALIDPSEHSGRTYRPTGPTLISPGQIVGTLSRVLGRRIAYAPVSDAMLSKALSADGWPVALQSQLRIYLEEYRRGAFAIGAPSDVIPRLLGREAEDFETIARRYAGTRPEARRSFAGRVAALAKFGRTLLTRTVDYDSTERRLNHVVLGEPTYALDSRLWRERAAGHASTTTPIDSAA
ncbi:MAG: NmrA family NAD(P)-binding protein [Thalassobaculaceae bacterium]